MTSSAATHPVRLVLSESTDAVGIALPWAGPLLALGTRVARWRASRDPQRQLIVALSVPARGFAAALLGCGWVLASNARALADPLTTLRALEPGATVRSVSKKYVVTGEFSWLDESHSPPRAQFAGGMWRVDGICALAALGGPEPTARTPRPNPGNIGRMARVDQTWDARLAAPAADLAIVGTKKWLSEEFDGRLSREGNGLEPSSIHDLLLPRTGLAATWYTRVCSAARLAEQLPLPGDLACVILDGSVAIRYLGEIGAPVVLCVLDRSVADETAAEIVVQRRNTRGQPLSVRNDLGWSAPPGVEILAFTVAL